MSWRKLNVQLLIGAAVETTVGELKSGTCRLFGMVSTESTTAMGPAAPGEWRELP